MNTWYVIKKNWIGITGLIIGIVSLCLSYSFYKKSTAPAEPVFLIDNVKTKIVDSKRTTDAPFKVIRKDGGVISWDVISVRFYFWNKGKKSIKKEHILEPITISLEGRQSEILECKLLKMTRNVVNAKFKEGQKPLNQRELEFDILEPGDGISCDLIYQDRYEAEIKISGTIEGVKRILTKEDLKPNYFFSPYYMSTSPNHPEIPKKIIP